MDQTDLEALIYQYMEAFEEQNLDRCLDFFADDAVLDFQGGVYRGQLAIKDWHKDRFAARLQIVRVDGIAVNGDTVTVDLVVTSDRLKAWRITRLPGTATYVFEQGRIKDARFGLRATNPLERWS